MPSSESPTSETENTVAVTAFHHELPYINRPKPRAYGVGRYGVAKYDERDSTRYAWSRVVPAISAFLLAMVLGAVPARAQNAYCESTDATTTSFLLCKPNVDAEGANRWGDKINTNFDMIETAFGTITAATASASIRLNALEIDSAALSISTKALSTGAAIVSGAIDSTKLATNSVTTIKIADGAVDTAKLGTDAVTSVKILTGNVDTRTIGTDAVTTVKIINGAVDSSKLATDAVTTVKIINGAVDTSKLATASVTNAKTVGTTATCGAGAFLGNATYVNGLPSGGACSTAGVGDAVLASTQSWSGANTFLSTTNFTGAVPGVYVEIASATVSAVTAYTFTATSFGISFSTEDFRLEYNMFQNTTAGGYTLTFNASGSGYLGILHETFSNGSEATEAATAYCSVTDTATEIVKVGTGSKGYMNFSTVPTRPDLRNVFGESHWTENSVSLATKSETGCTHTGSGQLTSVTFTATAGTMTGYLSLQVKRRR